jgi:hypothetical protein
MIRLVKKRGFTYFLSADDVSGMVVDVCQLSALTRTIVVAVGEQNEDNEIEQGDNLANRTSDQPSISRALAKNSYKRPIRI